MFVEFRAHKVIAATLHASASVIAVTSLPIISFQSFWDNKIYGSPDTDNGRRLKTFQNNLCQTSEAIVNKYFSSSFNSIVCWSRRNSQIPLIRNRNILCSTKTNLKLFSLADVQFKSSHEDDSIRNLIIVLISRQQRWAWKLHFLYSSSRLCSLARQHSNLKPDSARKSMR